MIAQTCHALSEMEKQHTVVYNEWYHTSNYICCLEVDSEEHLVQLIDKAQILNIKYALFKEPDLDNQITAVSFEPGKPTKKMLSNLPLALRNFS